MEINEDVLTINPMENLLPGKQYAIQIAPTAITDLGDNPYAGIVAPDTTTWSFTTDNTPPLALSISPAGVTNATQGTRLLVQFDKAVQVGSGSLTIRKTSDNSVVETIDVSTPGAVVIDDTMATVIRSVTLAPNTAYYVNATCRGLRGHQRQPLRGHQRHHHLGLQHGGHGADPGRGFQRFK